MPFHDQWKIQYFDGRERNWKDATERDYRCIAEKREVDAITVVAPPEIGILARTIKVLHGACIVIDESVDAVADAKIMAQIISSDNYYIFITRENIATVPYGIRNVFTLEGGLNHYRMRPMYNRTDYHKKRHYDVLICEDTASGFDIIKDHFQPHGYSVYSAGGKDNISREIREHWLNKMC